LKDMATARLRSGKIVPLLLLAVVTVCCSFAVTQRYQHATDPHLSLGEWEDSSVWWQQGKCVECHRQPSADESDDIHVAGPQPESHRDPSWHLNHGRSDIATEARCYTCHSTPSCQSCHDRRPKNHTEDFLRPAGDHAGATEHVVLGRLNPSSCLVCHKSLVTGCSRCHAPSETRQWQHTAMQALSQWPSLLDDTDTGHATLLPAEGSEHE